MKKWNRNPPWRAFLWQSRYVSQQKLKSMIRVWKNVTDFQRKSRVHIQLKHSTLCCFSQKHSQTYAEIDSAAKRIGAYYRVINTVSCCQDYPYAGRVCGTESRRSNIRSRLGDRGFTQHHIAADELHSQTKLSGEHPDYNSINCLSSNNSGSNNFASSTTTTSRDCNVSVLTMRSSSIDANYPTSWSPFDIAGECHRKSGSRNGVNFCCTGALSSNSGHTTMHRKRTPIGFRTKNYSHASTRAFSSRGGSNANENDSTKILLRHFLFQIHPDYFLQVIPQGIIELKRRAHFYLRNMLRITTFVYS